MINMKFSDGRLITPYLATAYAEGFLEGEDASVQNQIIAWAYLIETGMCWSLQGWFGRRASDLIENGIIDRHGNIDWEHEVFLRLDVEDDDFIWG